MILIFDLDDTLYDESRFVDGGLKAVARHGEVNWGWDAVESLDRLRDILAREGRGKVFDQWLQGHDAWSRGRVRDCVRAYRNHSPDIALFPAGRRMVDRYGARGPLYLVTDGHKIVQRNKVDALALWPDFQRIFITHRFGVAAAKPSTHCFERIRAETGCAWPDMVYVGDNPAKDFVNLNPLGVLTVRVLTGAHKDTQALPSHDALITIPDLDALPDALATRFPEAGI
ncbi:HAD family hydrolase [Brevundimonas sp. PWP3-1b1]|uniref:HAD family hydrolase n=1 Tax=unclassified Brevundimonas TaxID=2622653 RepID=UPI003CEEFAEB